MKWRDPAPIQCPACDGDFFVAVAALKSLRATCPGCGASLAVVGEWMISEQARIGRQIDLLCVALELEEHAGVVITDTEVDAARCLKDLILVVAGRLNPATDREARATELVTEVARRVAPRLLGNQLKKPES